MRGFVKRVSHKVSKLTDEQVEQLLTAISEENEMLDSILESLSSGLLIVDEKWHLLQNNKAAERFLPFSMRLEDSKVENIPIWKVLNDDNIADFLEECYKTDRSNLCEEFTTTTENGTVRFLRLCVTPLIRKNNLVGTVISAENITEKKNQEILLHRMESLAGLTNLAASVAHEIKNPLGAISIHIQLIQKAINKARESNGLLPSEKFLEKYLDVVNEEIENLNKIVVDFLFAVRPVSAKLVLSNPDKLIKKFADFFKIEFIEKQVDVKLQFTEKNTRVLLDEKLFREVIVNIAQNSLAAITEKFGGYDKDSVNIKESGKLKIKTSIKDENYRIVFEDNGIGMTETTVAHIFEPYYTTKANGTGLGMTMVYKIIKEFSGDIIVKSKRGTGTFLVITLPLPQLEKKLLTHNKNTQAPLKIFPEIKDFKSFNEAEK